ncbi:MAG: hypothetical protein LQ351_001043 [Letrouitia transgressa]|nr:MAG: hypothetical protein LQ351_001043 [Letrouitia transgressa]
MPFAFKVATKDFHPPNHVSFDISHPPPNNKAFESVTAVKNLQRPSETMNIPLWPAHCVQGTIGANIIPEIDVTKLDKIVEKGRNQQVEMFSAFADTFGNKSDAASLDLSAILKASGIEDVYVTGLAGDFCVRRTAIDAREEGFRVYVIEDATESINSGESGWGATKVDFRQLGIQVVTLAGVQSRDVQSL